MRDDAGDQIAADHRVTSTVQLGRYGLLIVTGNKTVCPAVAGLDLAVGTGDAAAVETAVGAGAGEAGGTGAVAAGMLVGAGADLRLS